MKTKVCSKCKIEKLINEFYKKPQNKNGLCGQCKICMNQQSKKYYQDNKETIKETNKKYRINNREKLKQQAKKYRANNKEKILKYRKNYQNRSNICQQKYYYTHPIQYLLHRSKNRAKLKKIECTITHVNIQEALKKCTNKNGVYICPILKIKMEINIGNGKGRQNNSLSIDRIDNAKGYIPENIVIMSWRANNIKGDGTAEEHRKIANFMKKHERKNKC